MTLENEFKEHYDRFHVYAEKSNALFFLYLDKKSRGAIESWVKSVPMCNTCFIKLLKIKDKRIIRVFKKWKSPDETAKDAHKILKRRIGGHLVSELTYTFWKYADIANQINKWKDSLTNRVLLEQSIVTMCSAFECYLKELIPWILKNNEESARRFLGGLNEPTKSLGRYKFEPLKHINKIYIDINKQSHVFDDLMTQYKEYFNIPIFFTKREEEYVRKIYQVRHCIVHNESKPDAKWRALTKGAKFEIDRNTTWKYIIKIHEKMHDVSSQVFDYMKLNKKYYPWHEVKEESDKGGMTFNGERWKFVFCKKKKKGK